MTEYEDTINDPEAEQRDAARLDYLRAEIGRVRGEMAPEAEPVDAFDAWFGGLSQDERDAMAAAPDAGLGAFQEWAAQQEEEQEADAATGDMTFDPGDGRIPVRLRADGTPFVADEDELVRLASASAMEQADYQARYLALTGQALDEVQRAQMRYSGEQLPPHLVPLVPTWDQLSPEQQARSVEASLYRRLAAEKARRER